MRSEATKLGAKIKDEIKLISVEDKKGSLILHLEDQKVRGNKKIFQVQCKKLIICPGAWLSPMMKDLFDINVKTEVLQMGYYYFETKGNDKSIYNASKFPVFIDYSENGHIYGTPGFEYPSLLKVGAHGSSFLSAHTSAHDRTFKVVPELLSHVQRRVSTYFPMADITAPVHSESCLYTWTKDEEFLLDYLPSNPNIIVGGGGSGHAFKHGAAIGEILANMTLDGGSKWNSRPEFSFGFHSASAKI